MIDGKNTFTIKISEMPDGSIDLWTKGMPDTRSFGGKPIAAVPIPHRLGIDLLREAMKLLDKAGLKVYRGDAMKEGGE